MLLPKTKGKNDYVTLGWIYNLALLDLEIIFEVNIISVRRSVAGYPPTERTYILNKKITKRIS